MKFKVGDRVIQKGGDPKDIGTIVHINEHGPIVALDNIDFEVSVREEDIELSRKGDRMKKIRMIIIHADGRPDTITLEDKEPTLERLQAAVGGFIEQIPHFSEYKRVRNEIVYANEYGDLYAPKKKPFNAKATRAWTYCPEYVNNNMRSSLRGDVVILQHVKA